MMDYLQPLLIGASAGCITVLITNPMDLAKTRLQLQGELQKKGQYQRQLNGVIDTLVKTSRNEGVLAVQKGLAPALMFQIVMNGFRLGMYENLKKYNQGHIKPHLQYSANVLLSGMVGFIGGYCGSPFNMIKTRLMLQSNFIDNGSRYHYNGFLHAISSIYRESGIQGLFKGSVLWGSRTGLGSAVQLPAFDLSRRIIEKDLGVHGTSALLSASAISTFLLCVIMCPVDGLSTRYFNQPFDQNGRGLLYKNAFQGALKIFQIEGVLGFYKGFLALVARVGPQSFLSLTLFNYFLGKLKQYQQ